MERTLRLPVDLWNSPKLKLYILIGLFYCSIYIMQPINPWLAAAIYLLTPVIMAAIAYLFKDVIFAKLEKLTQVNEELVKSHIRHEEQTKQIIRSVERLSDTASDLQKSHNRNASRLAQIATHLKITFMQE